MQTKKRAKPVKFGKKKEIDETKVLPSDVTKEVAEADINSDEAKEIKKLIEEKTHPHEELSDSENKEEEHEVKAESESDEAEKKDDVLPEQEEATENEPAEIRLSEEPEEKKEEQMALENTEPTAEVEPEELHDKEEKESEDEKAKSSEYGSFTNDAVKKEPKKGFLKFFLLVAFVTFLIGLTIIAGVSYFYSSDKEQSFALPSLQEPTPTPVTELTATPTPEEVDLTAYGVRILNGSGISGEAAKVRDDLEEKGFTVSGVGNASTSDYTKTIISAKDNVAEEYLNELIKALQGQYSVNSVVEDAPSTQTADVVVTVGSDSAE